MTALRRLESVLEALDGLSLDDRNRALDRLEPTLRALVDDFDAVEHDADAVGFLEVSPWRTADARAADAPPGHDERVGPGTRLGPYRLVEQIGRGGSSLVFRATRDDDSFSRDVAIKVLRRGAASVRRFRAERQLLADLEHPGIARLLDGGTTPGGVQYLAMELVQGLPLDRWCDEHRLGVEARVELLQEVCETVAWAHRRLIVHRDLKPSNILVSSDGRPKLLDFGIAKLIETSRTEHVTTEPWIRRMTPEYASPEQVRGEPTTAATDVYSLGILLFQTLTGRLPHRFDRETSSLEALERAQRRTSSPPSEIVLAPSTDAADSEGDAARRGSSRRELSRRLRGDLDVIVAKALHRDVERRYASAQHLADDLRRHLDGRPIAARPDAWSYRLGKAVRRHPAVSLLAVLLALAVTLSAVGLGVAAHRLQEQRDVARAERDVNARLVRFMQDLFIQADPWATRQPATLESLLREGESRLAAFDGQPEVQAPLLLTLGKVYSALGDETAAKPLLERAVDSLRRQRVDAETLADALSALGVARRTDRRLDEAAALHAEALELRRSIAPDGVTVAKSLANLAVVRRQQGEIDAAIELLTEALEIRQRATTTDPADLSILWSNLGMAHAAQGEFDTARDAVERALSIRREHLPEDHPLIANGISHLAYLHHLQKQPAKAEQLLREAIIVLERRLGPDHPDTLRNRGSRALTLVELGRAAEAEAVWSDVEARAREAFGDDHPLLEWAAGRGHAVPRDRSEAPPRESADPTP